MKPFSKCVPVAHLTTPTTTHRRTRNFVAVLEFRLFLAHSQPKQFTPPHRTCTILYRKRMSPQKVISGGGVPTTPHRLPIPIHTVHTKLQPTYNIMWAHANPSHPPPIHNMNCSTRHI